MENEGYRLAYQGRLEIFIPGKPIGKPRMTQRDKWMKRPSVVRYRDWCDRAREIAGVLPAAESVTQLSWTAWFMPPKSWTRSRRSDCMLGLHRAKPDRDNLDKALLDALFPSGDQAIAAGYIQKLWAAVDGLTVIIEHTDDSVT